MSGQPLAFRFFWPRVRDALNSGDSVRALRWARLYVRLRPGDPNSWETLSKVLMDNGDAGEAELILRKGSSLHSTPRLKYRLAEVLMGEKRLDEASRILEALGREHPDSPLVQLGRADIAIQGEHWIEATSQAMAALERPTPHDRWLKFEVAKRLLQIPGEGAGAIELLEQFCQEMPDEPMPHSLLAVLLEDLDRAASEKHLATARRLYGDSDHLADADLRLFRDWFTSR